MDWRNYTAEQVRTKSVDGVRLAKLFNVDFKEKFNRNTCLSCTQDFAKDFQKYINTMSDKKKEQPKYLLKKKFDGISIGFNKGRAFNATLTEKQAKDLIKNHPKGKDLFEVIPKEEPKKETPKKETPKKEKEVKSK